MIQDKAQSAGNGESFSMAATRYWIIRVAPQFERTVQQSFAVLRLLGGASREAVVCGVAPLGKDAPLPARRALRFRKNWGRTEVFRKNWRLNDSIEQKLRFDPNFFFNDSLNPSISP